MDILIVCTGNICRSPMVEALLARSLAQKGIAATVHSAGLLQSGRAASEGAQDVMADRGLDISGHRSTQITRDLVASSDLVIGMAREHVREAVVLDYSTFTRTFTLKELVRRGREIGPQGSDESLAGWLFRLHEGRNPADQLGDSPDDDVADPIAQRLAVYQRTATELVGLVDALTAMLAVPSPAADAVGPVSPLEPSLARPLEDSP